MKRNCPLGSTPLAVKFCEWLVFGMENFYNEYHSYIVPTALTLGLYFVLFTVIPFLFRKITGSKPVRQIVNSKAVATVANVVKPKPVFSFEFREVSGERAMAAFESAKTEGKGIPVLIGGGEHYRQSLADSAQYRKSKAESLRLATASPDPYKSKAKPRMPGTWENVGPFQDDGHPFLVKLHPEGFRELVTLAYIPAETSAEIPAYLQMGGWNAVPEADIMVALFRKWQRDYGAEIVAVSLDAIDVRVSRKPATREEALLLAREHRKFCATGTTLAEGAAELMSTNWWHFYWD
jgi:Domain of unknown function (DUF4253)